MLVPIIDDIETEPTETFGMVLSNPKWIHRGSGTHVGIIDDECSFELTTASVAENGEPLLIEVRRSGGVVNPGLSSTTFGMARPKTRPTTLWVPVELTSRSQRSPTGAHYKRIEMEGLESFDLMLINALVDPKIALEGSATLGELTEIQVTIIDDEMPRVWIADSLMGGANGPVHGIIVDQDGASCRRRFYKGGRCFLRPCQPVASRWLRRQ